MAVHYSQPKGFVGRNICYAVMWGNTYHGGIVGGSATLHLPGRHEFLQTTRADLDNIINNIFFHVEPKSVRYPCRNFTQTVLKYFRQQVVEDWKNKYGDTVIGFETLVELPRSGDCYIRDGWTLVGQTKGFQCKRVGGESTDGWGGRRVWNKDPATLRPKLVFCRNIT